MKIILVYNPKSGSALSKKELRQKCNEADIQVEAFIPIRDGFERTLAPHIKNAKNIAVIGGDGTVSAVAGLVLGTNATLVPLPGGTLNHFTKDLGIPQDVDEALGRLKKLKPRRIDIARMNDTFFINNSSIGIYPLSLHDREEIEPKVGKWPAAIVASLRAFIRLKTYSVTVDNETFKTAFIFIGNNRYSIDLLGGTERSSLDEGLLTIFIAKTQSRLVLLKVALFALIGMTRDLPEFEEIYSDEITIDTKRHKLSVSRDGEVSRASSPLKYSVEKGALRILG